MKVCFVVTHPSDRSPGTFIRILEIAKALSSLNVEAFILTPFKRDQEIVSEVNVVPLKSVTSNPRILSLLYQGARKLAAKRYGGVLFYSDIVIEKLIRSIHDGLVNFFNDNNTCDVLHAVQPIAGIACSSLSRKFNIPLVVDLHNCWPEEVLAQKLCTRGDQIFTRLQSCEQNAISAANSITVVSEPLKDYLIKNYEVNQKNIIVVPNGGTENSVLNYDKREKNVIYAGMVNFREHVDLFVQSIPYVKSNVRFYISNYGDRSSEIRRMVKRMGDARITLNWYPKRVDVLRLMNMSKLGIVTSRDDMTRQLGPPLKLYDYLSNGLPVIANDIGGWTEIIRKERLGLLTRDDPVDFASAIDALDDESKWYSLHKNAVNVIKEKYNWKTISKNVLIPLYHNIR